MASIVFNKNKKKNRINPGKLLSFENFANSFNAPLSGAFRDNVRIFLQNFAEIEEYTVNEMPVWYTLLLSESKGVFPLFTLEETIQSSSDDPFCCYCEFSGWGHHFVCKRKYHFIIPTEEHWDDPLGCEFEEYHYHYLYGLIHCNGYGHLVGTNGSKFFSADDSMEFWDQLCTVLKARSILAYHVSTEEAIELSLVHAIAHGKSWFGKWGYKFWCGMCPGITECNYNAAIQFLSTLRLEKLVNDSRDKTNMKKIKKMIEMYREFSGNPLITLSDLLKFMLALESRILVDVSDAHKFEVQTGEIPVDFQTFVDAITRDCRWSAKRLEDVLFVIVNLLKQHKMNNGGRACGMSRQELRNEARKSIGDTGLIDFVLKSIKCFTMGDRIICRAINPVSRLTEFTIHEISLGTGMKISMKLGLSFLEDIMFLYENVLIHYSECQIAMQYIFVKEWPIRREIGNHSMELICKLLPSFDELETELRRTLSPGEVVVVEPQITIRDFKMVVQFALRDTYCIMDELKVTQIGGLRKIEDELVLHTAIEPGSQVWIRGHGLDFDTQLRYEDGGNKAS